MRALWYKIKRTFINNLKYRLKKPLTYVYGLVIIGYCYMMFFSFDNMFELWNINTPEGLFIILTAITLVMLPSNFFSFAKRKGLIFKKSDVHMIFPAPLKPKTILVYAYIKTIVIGLVISIALSAGAVAWFNMPVTTMIIYFLMSFVIENLLEMAIMLIVYGNESIPEWGMKVIKYVILGILAAIVAVVGYLFYTSDNRSLTLLGEIFTTPLYQCIPVFGWYAAFIELLILGPTTVNIICTVLYVALTVILLLYVIRMRCTGEYYEDAISFAEDMAIRQEKAKTGRVEFNFGKKKFKKASVTYKGKYAKAIYYRQILEYKKNPWFIFGWSSLINLAIGIGLIFLAKEIPEEFRIFVIPAVSAYVAFIFSGHQTKWSKELENAYTFLIPDYAIRKLWYATQVEHMRAFVDGLLICLPAGIGLGMNPLQILLSALIYVCMKAIHLYSSMICDGVFAQLFGNFGMTMVRMTMEVLVLGIGVAAAVVPTLLVSVELGFIVLIFYSVVMTVGMALGASVIFSKMESLK